MEDEDLLLRILDKVEDPTNLPLALLQKITGNFSQDRKIGQGGFGEVYKGILGERIVAVKRIYINENTVDDRLFRREFASLWNTNHQNIVRFLGFCSTTHHKTIDDGGSGEVRLANVLDRLLCFEYIGSGSLDKHINDELRGLEWETRYEIITGICEGLRYLHNEKNIIHMDLKPANILLDHHDEKNMVPKITDFGLSRPNQNSHTVGQCYGTLGYWAPEYRENSKTTPACDIYSLGAIIMELVTGGLEVPNKDNILRRWRHRWNMPPTPLQYHQVNGCIDIAVRCREHEPKARPSISEIISTLSKPKSTAVQEINTYMDDDMLGIEPLELHFNKDMSWSVKLTNKTKSCFAFKIERPSKQYTIGPDKGIVRPGCNEYLVQITLQPQEGALLVTQSADKFVVQSTRVSIDGREEDITEHTFQKEASKVVDEVNLMVVPKAQQRKIGQSASGKGKLGSSKNAEATSMDINSSGRGQCVRQTEQCNLHTLQSFSRHYPTNLRYLQRASERSVDLARGAMGSLLDKLGKLVTEEYSLDTSIKTDIESFSEDLMIMHRDILELENVDGAKIWVDKVRELSYYIEDMVDSFLVHVEPDSSRSGFKELMHEGLKLWDNGMLSRHQIGAVFRDIRNQVRDVAHRKEKFKFDVNNVVPNAAAKPDIDDLRNLVIYEDKQDLIGIETPRYDVIRLLEDDGDVSKQNLRIISIVGPGGYGKTTLAKAVYDKLQAQYDTRAFVPVGRNPDVKKVLRNIISQFEKDLNAENMNVHQLIKILNEFLENKRYFIVIDDLWDSESSLPSRKKEEAWVFIKYSFPRNKHGSRLITTTRNHDVALACCNAESKYVYRINPLGEEESRKLFWRRIFGPQKHCPDTLRKEEISIDILKRCGGMPLAIKSIASFLAGKPEATWEYVGKSLGVLTEEDNGLEDMKQILDLSYIHLPNHLKTCLLYVCNYPEDDEIDKKDLLRQWVAEGFVSTNSRLDAEDVAEDYFQTLIKMCMIQPGKIDYNNEVLSCRVHDIILDLMRSKSTDVNFIQVIDDSKHVTAAHGEIHRVSVQCSDEDLMRILEEMKYKRSLSHVRSVFLYRGSLVPYFVVFKYIRVLRLEEYEFKKSPLDLTGISMLFLLRYLKIGYDTFSKCKLKLPDQIGKLQQLETIDIQACQLEHYPSDIVSLPRLSHLGYHEGGIALPDGIGRLKSLRTLEGVRVFGSSEENLKGLGELPNLRKLQLCLGWSHERTTAEVITTRMNALHLSISRLSTSLRSLAMNGHSFDVQKLQGCSSTLINRGSYIRVLDLRGCIFQSCPKWIGELQHVYSLHITLRVADGINIIGGLPSLALFYMEIPFTGWNREIPSLHASTVIFGSGAFTALKHLVLDCEVVSPIFEEGTLPKLEKLDIAFRHLPVGIENLPAGTLKEISLFVTWDDGLLVESHKYWTSEVWHEYEKTYDYTDRLRKCSRKLRSMLTRAFKRHHPRADINITLGCYREPKDAYGEDYEEDDESVDDEENYRAHVDVVRLCLIPKRTRPGRSMQPVAIDLWLLSLLLIFFICIYRMEGIIPSHIQDALHAILPLAYATVFPLLYALKRCRLRLLRATRVAREAREWRAAQYRPRPRNIEVPKINTSCMRLISDTLDPDDINNYEWLSDHELQQKGFVKIPVGRDMAGPYFHGPPDPNNRQHISNTMKYSMSNDHEQQVEDFVEIHQLFESNDHEQEEEDIVEIGAASDREEREEALA